MFTGMTTYASFLVTAVVVLTGAANLRGGAAAADSNEDDQFLALLNQEGVPALSGVPSLIATAHEVCHNLDGGMSADALVDALINNANVVTPGADPARLRRSETRFVIAAVGAYCPNDQGKVAFTNPAGSNGRLRVMLASRIEGVTPPRPTLPPSVPDAQTLIPRRQAVQSAPPKKAPPVVGPPPGAGGGGGGNGGGTGGIAPRPPVEPGIITLAP
jgi:Protein of unknown function (DUF732)